MDSHESTGIGAATDSASEAGTNVETAPTEAAAGIFWIWPLGFSPRLRTRLDQSSQRLAERLSPGRLTGIALLIGIVPCLLSLALGVSIDRPVTAVLVAPLLIATVRRDSTWRGFGLLATVFGTHCAIVIAVTAWQPDRIAEIFPAGQKYWDESQHWIRTGESPEYQLSYWVPAHFQQAVGGAFLTFCSLGAVLVWEGLYQVDLMNVYVGNLAAQSDGLFPSLLLGWHPWSLLRGIGFLVLGFEVTSWSFERMIGIPLSTRRRRAVRWSVAILFLVSDGVVKYSCLESVRTALHAHLHDAA